MIEILYFSAPWCGPCKAMKPAIDKFETTLDESKVKITRVNIDEDSEHTANYKIQSVPTFVFVKDLITLDVLVGIQPVKNFNNIIQKWS
jgi:thioredoxin-like negative regulator of GroEL